MTQQQRQNKATSTFFSSDCLGVLLGGFEAGRDNTSNNTMLLKAVELIGSTKLRQRKGQKRK